MFGITDIVTYTIAAAVLVALPGPNSMLCMAIAAQHGVKVARRAMAGTFLGNGTLIVASALGAGSVLAAWPFLYNGLRMVGASYLAFLGGKMLWGAWRTWRAQAEQRAVQAAEPGAAPMPPQPAAAQGPVQETPRVFKKALMVALLNPKGLLFFPSMMVQFVDVRYPYPVLSFLVLGLIFQTLSMVFLNLMAPMASRISRFAAHHRKTRAAGKGGVGALFLAFAAKLWAA